ncbi:unannotated protein [freshwater metagenome]|uniref:Unannotated protein n=1 Tax=freshwater metagenome TaxID=449393 RepID=A0A6J7EI31_9ZZZZ
MRTRVPRVPTRRGRTVSLASVVLVVDEVASDVVDAGGLVSATVVSLLGSVVVGIVGTVVIGVSDTTTGKRSFERRSSSCVRTKRANRLRPAAVRLTRSGFVAVPLTNQRSALSLPDAVFQSNTVNCVHRNAASVRAALAGAKVAVPSALSRRSERLTHNTRLTPRASRASMVWSIAAPIVVGSSVYPACTTAKAGVWEAAIESATLLVAQVPVLVTTQREILASHVTWYELSTSILRSLSAPALTVSPM